jgi:hypothetical protein
MQRKNPHISLLSLAGIFSMLAAAPASAADLAGKWYGKLDSAPVIIIDKAGSGYSASLDHPDIMKSVQRTGDTHPYRQSIHRDVAFFEVADNTLHFTIRNTISWNGDTNFARDEYDLTLSQDGRQLAGTVRHITISDGNDFTNHSVPQTVTPITLYPTDYTTRLQPQVPQ